MLKEFREFAVRGNVIDLAVAVIIGTAFTKIVTSLVNDIIMPPIGRMLGKADFGNFFVNLTDTPVTSVAEAKKAGIATINYGIFINTVFEFIIVAFAVFLLVRQINRLKKEPPPVPANTRDCPYCCSAIPIPATRCPQCTSSLATQ